MHMAYQRSRGPAKVVYDVDVRAAAENLNNSLTHCFKEILA